MERTITVKGVGSASTKPDQVQITLNLNATNLVYQKAMDMAAIQLDYITAGLAPCGILKEDVKTTRFGVDAEYEQQKDSHGNYKRVFTGYQCEHCLMISFDFDMKVLAQVLNALASCEAHPELSIRFTVKDQNALKNDVLAAAATDAKAKAEILAKASGVKLGDLQHIDYSWGEISLYSDTEYSAPTGVMACERSIDIEPDDVKLNDSVTFVWAIS
jgi:uncharacterized protein YggE